jgi:nitrite reductase (NO-forming)
MILSVICTVITVAGKAALPQTLWTMVHVITLGVLTNGILQWSWYFTRAVLRLPSSDRRAGRSNVIRIVAFNIGIVLLAAGMWKQNAWLTVVMAGCVGVIIAWHGFDLLSCLKERFGGRLKVIVLYYAVASVFLVVGCVLAGFVTAAMFDDAAPSWLLSSQDKLTLAHAFAGLLGWVGITIAGTLVMLGPTVLRGALTDYAVPCARKAVVFLSIGTAVAIAGALSGSMVTAGIGLLMYGTAVGIGVLMAVVHVAVRKPPQTFAAWCMTAGVGWSAVAFGAITVNAFLANSAAAMRELDLPWLAIMGAGGLGQIFIASLSNMMPVVIGGGPRAVRIGGRILDAVAPFRMMIRNTSLVFLTIATQSSSTLRIVWWALVIATYIVDIALLAVAGIRQMRAHKTGPQILIGANLRYQPSAERRESTQAESAGGDQNRPTEIPSQLWRGNHPLSRVAAGVIGALAVVAMTVAAIAANPSEIADVTSTDETTTGAIQATGETTEVTVTIEGMAYTPSNIEVPAGNELVVTLINNGDQRHNLVLATGASLNDVAPGSQVTGSLGVITESTDGWCSITGHRQMGMVLTVTATGGSAASNSESTAESGTHASGTESEDGTATAAELQDYAETVGAYSAELEPLTDETDHYYTFTVTEQIDQVTGELSRTLWTYNGTSPGPVLHGRIGDTFHITLVNNGTMGHSIDFHAGEVSPDGNMTTIEPGESITYTFTAHRSGIWMYHCSTAPMSNHIANGMYGAVVIEPENLSQADRSYVLIQGEEYLGADGEPADASKVAAGVPDVVTFNGRAFQYDANPLHANTGERVRIWVLDAGPNESLAFHVVGAQFDTVWKEGAYSVYHGESRDGVTEGTTGSQVLSLGVAEGGFVEFVPVEAGSYAFVNHQMSLAEKGAHGTIVVSGD